MGTGSILTSVFLYDAADQLISATLPSDSAVASRAYAYDLAGNRTREQVDVTTTAFSFNSVNQLTAQSAGSDLAFTGTVNEPATLTVGGNAATVDAAGLWVGRAAVTIGANSIPLVATDLNGNVTSKTITVTVSGGSARTLAYDLNGNLTNDGAGKTYAYDAVNRLITITQGSNVTTFVYNGLGRRVQEKLNGAVIKQWVWDGTAMAEERNSGNTVTKRFFGYGEQIGGSNHYFTADHLGSIREMIDSTGAIRARYDYDPYGRITKVSGDLDADFGYTGFYRHQASGLNLTLYRAYDPELGRWLSRDPIGENGGINLYGYIGNNPINSVDPFGLWPTGAYGSQNVHGNAITRVLGGTPRAADITALIQQQVIADEDETAAGSYKHAMRSPNQTVAQAKALANFYVRYQIERARQLEKQKCHEQALASLGNAMHTLQDSTSPMHNGFQQWDGDPRSWAALQHGRGENYDPGAGSQLDQATSDALKYFNGAPMPQDFFIYHADPTPHN